MLSATNLKKYLGVLALLAVVFVVAQPLVASAEPVKTGESYYGTANTSGTANPTNQGWGTQSAGGDIGCKASLDDKNVAICVSNLVYYVMVGLFSSFAYICAFFFDLAIQLSLNSSSYALDFLSSSWTLARDIANMSFIFMLVYIAFIIIFEADTTNTVKMLATVIIVALLVNFSFFFTRLVIDSGNIVASQFYNAIQAPPIGATAGQGWAANTAAASIASGASGGQTKDLTAGIMGALQIQGLFSNASFQQFVNNPNSSAMYLLTTLSLIYIFMGVMFGILAGSFLFAGAKFMMRVVGLWVVLFMSPIAFASKALAIRAPFAKQLWEKWSSSLIEFTIYPAVYLFMFWVLSKFVAQMGSGSLFNGLYNAASASAGSGDSNFLINIATAMANVGIRMGFIVALMYAALSVADMVSKTGNGLAKSFSSFAGNAVTGGALGFLGRNTLGRFGGAMLSQEQRLGRPNSGQARVGAWLSTRSYDLRNTPGVRQTVGPLLGAYQPTTSKISSLTPHGTLPVDFGRAQAPGPSTITGWFNRRPRAGVNQPQNAPQQPGGGGGGAPVGGGPAGGGNAPGGGGPNPRIGGGGSAFTQEAGTADALRKYQESLHEAVRGIKELNRTSSSGFKSVRDTLKQTSSENQKKSANDNIKFANNNQKFQEKVHEKLDDIKKASEETPPPPPPRREINESMDYYSRLDVPEDATKEEISRAFRILSKEFHPDTDAGSLESMKLISEAYNALKNPQSRQKYDARRPFKKAA